MTTNQKIRSIFKATEFFKKVSEGHMRGRSWGKLAAGSWRTDLECLIRNTSTHYEFASSSQQRTFLFFLLFYSKLPVSTFVCATHKREQ